MASRDATTAWSSIEDDVLRQLGVEDDAAAWKTMVIRVMRDAEYLCRNNPGRTTIRLKLGCCSHWRRPHQTRWTADGGFAWPSGYLGAGYSRDGLPEHDWEIARYWDGDRECWRSDGPTGGAKGRRLLEFRVSIPDRTARHRQAAVLALWQPGCPPEPKKELRQLYGFRNVDGVWRCTATDGPDEVYEQVDDA